MKKNCASSWLFTKITPLNVSICMLITSSLGHMEWSRVRSLLVTNVEYKNNKTLVPVQANSTIFNEQKLHCLNFNKNLKIYLLMFDAG